MNTIISLRTQSTHRRIDITAPELQPTDISIEVTPGEQKLIAMFREFGEVEKKYILAEMSSRSAAAKRERKHKRECEIRDAERAKRRIK